MKRFLFVIFVFCCLNSAANELPESEIRNRQGGFINTFYQKQAKTSDRDMNFLFCPVSVKLSMGMLMNGTNDCSKNEMLHAMNFDGLSMSDINKYNHRFLTLSNDTSSVNRLLIANGLWINSCLKTKAKVKSKYIDLISDSYLSDMHIRDFCENKSVVENEMSQWVSDRTNRFLKCAPEVSETDAIVAINTVYFKGIWSDAPITPSHELPFYNRNGSVADCKYLKYTKKRLPYFENKYFRAVKLFYQNAGYSLIVILPNRKMRSMETETMAKIVSDTVNRQQPQENKNNLLLTDYHFKESSQVEQISIADKLKKEAAGIKFSMKEQVEQFSLAGKLKKNKEPAYFYDFSQLSGNKECMEIPETLYETAFPERKESVNEDVFLDVDSVIAHMDWNLNFKSITFDEVRVPHFETECDINLKLILTDMGVHNIFVPNANSLNQIADDLFVSNYMQKVKIKVDEVGTEAAAVTTNCFALSSGIGMKRKPVTFIADHPFLYAICDERTGTILFMGRVVNLEK